MSAKKVCPHRENIMAPCFMEDGADALRNGNCISCGKTPAEIEAELTKPTVVLTEEQRAMARKINHAVNVFAGKMKAKMIKSMVAGKTGWDTLPAWQFMDGFDKNVNNIREATDIAESTVDLANFSMMIGMRVGK
jgi:hypothetical protein